MTSPFSYHVIFFRVPVKTRREMKSGGRPKPHIIEELREVLTADISNGAADGSPALELLDSDPREFVRRYFIDLDIDKHSKGSFSVTSR